MPQNVFPRMHAKYNALAQTSFESVRKHTKFLKNLFVRAASVGPSTNMCMDIRHGCKCEQCHECECKYEHEYIYRYVYDYEYDYEYECEYEYEYGHES